VLINRWLANLRLLEIAEIKSVPYIQVSHPVERVIGTIWREYLDRRFFWNAVDLTRKLEEFKGLVTVVAAAISPQAAARRLTTLASLRRSAIRSSFTIGGNMP
jgi:hypothetical protein